MILYLDASALVKCYVEEQGSHDVVRLIQASEIAGTGVLSRAEVVAAIARATRIGSISREDGELAIAAFEADWANLVRLQTTEAIIAQAARLAWQKGLRGYDAVHLACAMTWRDALQRPVTMVTYDRELWQGAQEEGLDLFPHEW
ncbi:Ribonuclease VapC49 [bacterium HR16]|nr:Ribonuclease VapC49 [bacterium HR16]